MTLESIIKKIKTNLKPSDNDLELFLSFSSEQWSKQLVNRTPYEKVMVKKCFIGFFLELCTFLSFSAAVGIQCAQVHCRSVYLANLAVSFHLPPRYAIKP